MKNRATQSTSPPVASQNETETLRRHSFDLITETIEIWRSYKQGKSKASMPIKFSREILRLYFEKGIEAFAIDAGTKDIINNEADFRLILSEINGYKPLSKVFLYACNLGYSLFEKTKTRADDFLGFFAYVDVLGGTFKTRGGPPMGIGGPPRPQRAKIFSRDEYAYEIFSYQEASQRLGRPVSPTQLQAHNQESQRLEANHVRSLVGQEPIKAYVTTKPAVDATSMKRLESIAKEITPS